MLYCYLLLQYNEFFFLVQIILLELSGYSKVCKPETEISINYPCGNVEFLHSRSCYNSFNLDIGHGSCLQLIMNTESVSFPNTLLRPSDNDRFNGP